MVELVKTPTPIQAGDAALVNRGGVPEMVVLGTAATADTNIFATSVQGSTADSAVQPGDLSSVAFSGSYADLINIPTTFTPSAHTHTVSEITDFPVLAIVATSGSYNDLLNLPALFDGAYSSLSGIPTTFAPSAHTHTVSEITDFPVLATVATSGSYNDLLNLPVLFDGSYTSLSNIPTTFAPSAHTHTVSEITDLTATAVELNQLSGQTAYTRSNILGTVSQSAGVPTGAIIERGSNANGEFVKYADGTLIMFRNVGTHILSSTLTTHGSTMTDSTLFSYPVTPTGSRSLGVDCYPSDSGGNRLGLATTVDNVWKLVVHKTSNEASTIDRVLFLKFYFIGRWY